MKKAIRLSIFIFSTALFFNMSSSCSVVKETAKLPLLTCQIELSLPQNEFRIKKENYEEGMFYTLYDRNGAYIIVFEGSLMQFLPEDTLSMYQVKRNKGRRISTGIADNLFWRKDSIDRIRLLYNRVTDKSKKSFDEILNSAKIIGESTSDYGDSAEHF